MPFDCLAGSLAELLDCRRALPAGAAGLPLTPPAGAAGLPAKLPRQSCWTAARAAGWPPELRQQSGTSALGVRRGSFVSSPAAPVGELRRQLSSGSTIPFSSMSRFNLDFSESKPKFLCPNSSQLYNTLSFYLLWKYQRRQTQSL